MRFTLLITDAIQNHSDKLVTTFFFDLAKTNILENNVRCTNMHKTRTPTEILDEDPTRNQK